MLSEAIAKDAEEDKAFGTDIAVKRISQSDLPAMPAGIDRKAVFKRFDAKFCLISKKKMNFSHIMEIKPVYSTFTTIIIPKAVWEAEN